MEVDVRKEVISIGSDQRKIMYDMVQHCHFSGMLKCSGGEGCQNTEEQANLEPGMWVSIPQGC